MPILDSKPSIRDSSSESASSSQLNSRSSSSALRAHPRCVGKLQRCQWPKLKIPCTYTPLARLNGIHSTSDHKCLTVRRLAPFSDRSRPRKEGRLVPTFDFCQLLHSTHSTTVTFLRYKFLRSGRPCKGIFLSRNCNTYSNLPGKSSHFSAAVLLPQPRNCQRKRVPRPTVTDTVGAT